MLGFGDVPSWPVSIIDFHGLDNDTIPYELGMSEGEGPGATIISWDGYYYYDKQTVIQTYADGLGCGPAQVSFYQGVPCLLQYEWEHSFMDTL